MIVYAITNRLNGKRYIGVTGRKLAERWYKHCWDAQNRSRFALHRAIRKYGPEAFDVQHIASPLLGSTRAVLGQLEIDIIAQEGTMAHGYNQTPGGEGWSELNRSRKGEPSPKRGIKMSDEARAKMRARWTPEYRAAWSAALTGIKKSVPSPKKGKPMSDEQRAKLREAWARNPERRKAQAEANSARGQSEDARAKISAAHSRPERIEALRQRNAVMNKTPEHGARISAGRAAAKAARAADQQARRA